MVLDEDVSIAYLTILDKAFEIDRPSREKPDQNVKRNKSTENNGSIPNVNARNNGCQPQNINNGKGKHVQSPCQVPLPQQLNSLHHFPSHMEPRHLSTFHPQIHDTRVKMTKLYCLVPRKCRKIK
jgi:hypothetical protein